MSWIKMAIDEYADLEIKNGAKIFNVDGIWWKEIRSFFYRPLFPFLKSVPGEVKPPYLSCLGGFQHLVPSPDLANSYMNLLAFDEIHDYSLDKLTHDYRKHIKKAFKNFTIKPISDLSEFVSEGHRVYKSFYERTHYCWRKDRIEQSSFAEWAEALFNYSKLLILGAYRDDRVLTAISVSFLVEDIIMYETFFSNTESLKLRAPELMLHTIREMASECEDARYIYMGTLGSRGSLDEFKISRGCKVLAEPAYFKINPVLLYLIKHFNNKNYEKIIGMNKDKINEILKIHRLLQTRR